MIQMKAIFIATLLALCNFVYAQQNTEFKKIKVRNGLDCIAIMQMMLNVITTEASQGK